MDGNKFKIALETFKRGIDYKADAPVIIEALQKADLAQSLADALESIAKNTCCEGCQEAEKVARAALANYRKGE